MILNFVKFSSILIILTFSPALFLLLFLSFMPCFVFPVLQVFASEHLAAIFESVKVHWLIFYDNNAWIGLFNTNTFVMFSLFTEPKWQQKRGEKTKK